MKIQNLNFELILGPLIVLLVCFLIGSIDKKRCGQFITPFIVMAWPYTIIVLTINYIGVAFGFFPVSLYSILFVLTGFISFYFGTRLVPLKSESLQMNRQHSKHLAYFDFYRPLFVILAIVSIVAGFFHFFQSINEVGWLKIGSEEFDQLYGYGVYAHITIMGRMAFIFLFADYLYKRKKYIIPLLFLMFLVVLARQVKYHIFGILLGGFFFSYFNGLVSISLKKIVYYSVVVFAVFIGTYYISLIALGSDYAFAKKTQGWLVNLFFTYLFGGPIGFSEILKESYFPVYDFEKIFSAPINLFKVIFTQSELVDMIIRHRVNVSNHYKIFHDTNVYGMIGMLYMYLGTSLTMIYLFFLGIITTVIYKLANLYIGFKLLLSFFMAYLTVSFFDIYFNKLTFIEVSFYMVVIPFLYKLLYDWIVFIKESAKNESA